MVEQNLKKKKNCEEKAARCGKIIRHTVYRHCCLLLLLRYICLFFFFLTAYNLYIFAPTCCVLVANMHGHQIAPITHHAVFAK